MAKPLFPMSNSLLSPEELDVLQDRRFMPLKFSASQKIEMLLASLRSELVHALANPASPAPEALRKSGGKISRGENYHTYAYRVLDCPGIFQKEDIFAFRTLVLWGHHIGFHLLMTGDFKARYQARVLERRAQLDGDFFLSREEIPWQWFRNETEQLPLKSLSDTAMAEMFAARKFLKISTYLPLDRYAEIPTQGAAIWQAWESILLKKGE